MASSSSSSSFVGPLRQPRTLLLLSLLAAPWAHAEGDAPERQILEAVQVTGNPLGNKELAQPGQALSGDALLLRRR